MTQDALPADRDLIRNLTAPLKEPETAAAYARQLPNASCSFVERYTRSFNYPDKSSVKSREDLPVYGIKTFSVPTCARHTEKTFMKVWEDLPDILFLMKI